MGLEETEMTERQVFVNGHWVPESQARVSVFDRAFLMADGIYEVVAVLQHKLVDFPRHVARLQRSADALQLSNPFSEEQWLAVCREAIARNQLAEGLIYWQVTRGVADRDFIWPEAVEPGVVLFTQGKSFPQRLVASAGLRILTQPDQRWGRCDIKTTQLLYSSWAKMIARQAGKDDAWLIDAQGLVTEGTSSNAFIVQGNEIWTRQLQANILPGVTRSAVLQCAQIMNLDVVEQPFTVTQAQSASEAFVTSATQFVMPVLEIDGQPIGSGLAGPVSQQLREIYLQIATDEAL